MAVKKGTIKEKDKSTGVVSELYPKTSIDQVENLSTSLNNRYTKDETYSSDETDDLLADKADDDAVVHLTGDETVSGIKTIPSIEITQNGSIAIDANIDALRAEYDSQGYIQKIFVGDPEGVDKLYLVANGKIASIEDGKFYFDGNEISSFVDLNDYIDSETKISDFENIFDTDKPYQVISSSMVSSGILIFKVVRRTKPIRFTSYMLNYFDAKGYYSYSGEDDLLSNILVDGNYHEYALSENIPTVVSDLENDAGYITEADIAGKEDSSNKVTSVLPSSTDVQYPSAKCVYDNLQNVREVAEGKCKTYVISYNESALTEQYFLDGGVVYKTNGDIIDNWADFYDYVQGEDIGNSYFNSQSSQLDITQEYIFTNEKFVILPDPTVESIKTGDIILVQETDVPDRWVNLGGQSVYYEKLETSKVDLTNYVDKTSDEMIDGLKTFADVIRIFDDSDKYRGIDNFDGADIDTTYYANGIMTDESYINYISFPNNSGTFALLNDYTYITLPVATKRYDSTLARIEGDDIYAVKIIASHAGTCELTAVSASNGESLTIEKAQQRIDADFEHIEITECDKLYGTKYSIPDETFVPFRLGTGSARGYIEFKLLDEPTDDEIYVDLISYFSYNGQSGAYTSYETTVDIYVDGTYKFTSELDYSGSDIRPEVTTVTIPNVAKDSFIQIIVSNDSESTRCFFSGLRYEYQAPESRQWSQLAKQEDIYSLDERIDVLETKATNHETRITSLEDGISRMGTIQLFDCNARSLPTPSVDYIDKVLRFKKEFYHCISTSENKVFSFENVQGTTNITSANYDSFAAQVTGGFKDVMTWIDADEVLTAASVARNNGEIKLGTSSKVGSFTCYRLDDIDENISYLVLNVKPWNNTKYACIQVTCESSEGEVISDNTYWVDPSDYYQTISVPVDCPPGDAKLYGIHISSVRDTVPGTSTYSDYRLFIQSIEAVYGEAGYEWRTLGGGGGAITNLVSGTIVEKNEEGDN